VCHGTGHRAGCCLGGEIDHGRINDECIERTRAVQEKMERKNMPAEDGEEGSKEEEKATDFLFQSQL